MPSHGQPVPSVVDRPSKPALAPPPWAKPIPTDPLAAQKQAALAYFRGLKEPLFGLFDAARNQSILPLLLQGGCPYLCLYEGKAAQEMAEVAPYLVRLPAKSELLESLILQGWGDSWGIYLTSHNSLEDLQKHFRRFVMVQLPDGEPVYFRFYDPRVLRVFCRHAAVNSFPISQCLP